MSKKQNKQKQRELRQSNSESPSYQRGERELAKMKHKDLQRACVARGLDFTLAVSYSIPDLAGWFCTNYDFSQNLNFLNEFDDWKDLQLKEKHPDKDDPVYHPSLRLGFIATRDDQGNTTSTKKPRLKGLDKKKKDKKERLAGTKIFAGTKKALSTTLAMQKPPLTIAEITEKVLEQFPDAKDKSISIWIKRARK